MYPDVSIGRVAAARGAAATVLSASISGPAGVGQDAGFLRKPRRLGYSGPEDSRCDHSRGRWADYQSSNNRMTHTSLVDSEICINIVYLTTGYTMKNGEIKLHTR